MKEKTFWVLTELFYPEETSTAYIMTQISQHIANSRNVHVICGPAAYQQSQISGNGKDLSNLKITRVNTGSFDKDKLLQRTFRLLILSWKLAFTLFRKARRQDDVLLVTNPAPLLVMAAFICKWKRLRCYTIVHDVFPENLVAANLIKKKSISYQLLEKIFNNAYSKMSVLLVIGRDMKALFEKKLSGYKQRPDIHIVENWADIDSIIPENREENALVRQLDINNSIIFQFAGNLGRVQGLQELFAVIREIRNPVLHFMFIGEGAMKQELKLYAGAHGMTNVSILDSFPRSRQGEFLNAADVGIVSLQEGMVGLGVPSKSYNILAAGKPILYIGDIAGEIGQMVTDNKVGWCFQLHDKQRLIDFFNQFTIADKERLLLTGIKARELAVNVYSREKMLDKYAQILIHDEG
jgi:glycosyltransferase involved in cell wall biosynthesis